MEIRKYFIQFLEIRGKKNCVLIAKGMTVNCFEYLDNTPKGFTKGIRNLNNHGKKNGAHRTHSLYKRDKGYCKY